MNSTIQASQPVVNAAVAPKHWECNFLEWILSNIAAYKTLH